MKTQSPTLALYHKDYCPYCMLTRKAIKKLGLDIELRDTESNAMFRNELVKEGGKRQVPCLRIEDAAGNVQWMYESMDIIKYLRDYQAQLQVA
ncbi:MAG: glutaredoxin domain-containing protein [Pseudomonadota bacterium]